MDEGEKAEVSHPYVVKEPVAGMEQDASRMGGGSLVLGSMVLKEAGKTEKKSR